MEIRLEIHHHVKQLKRHQHFSKLSISNDKFTFHHKSQVARREKTRLNLQNLETQTNSTDDDSTLNEKWTNEMAAVETNQKLGITAIKNI